MTHSTGMEEASIMGGSEVSRPSLALTPTHSCPAISVAIISFDICPFLTLVQLVTWHSFLLSGPLCLTFGGFWASCVKLWSYLQGHMRSGATEIQESGRRPASSLRPFLRAPVLLGLFFLLHPGGQCTQLPCCLDISPGTTLSHCCLPQSPVTVPLCSIQLLWSGRQED